MSAQPHRAHPHACTHFCQPSGHDIAILNAAVQVFERRRYVSEPRELLILRPAIPPAHDHARTPLTRAPAPAPPAAGSSSSPAMNRLPAAPDCAPTAEPLRRIHPREISPRRSRSPKQPAHRLQPPRAPTPPPAPACPAPPAGPPARRAARPALPPPRSPSTPPPRPLRAPASAWPRGSAPAPPPSAAPPRPARNRSPVRCR